MWNNRAAWHTCSLTLPLPNVNDMGIRQKVKEAMDVVRAQARDLDDSQYEEFLDQIRFEIESEIELCGWHSTESDGEEE